MSEKCFGQIVYSMNLHPDHLCEPPLLLRTDKFNLPKILNGPKGNKACKTAASVEMLNGLENPHGVRLPKKSIIVSSKQENQLKCGSGWNLKDHVPNGQTVTSLLRFNKNQSYSELMSGGKGVAAITLLLKRILLTKLIFIFPGENQCLVPAIQPLPPPQVTVTEHTEDKGLGVNICCSSGSALCQTGNNDGNSWNFPFIPL